MKLREVIEDRFARLACKASEATGSFWAFSLALFSILVWGVTGPLFDYSEEWQLVVNTGTTIITFLMVFLIQHAQNNDMRAVQLKLNELIAAIDTASNRLIDVEDLSEHEVQRLYARYRRLVHTSARVDEEHGEHAADTDDLDAEHEGVEHEDAEHEEDDPRLTAPAMRRDLPRHS